MENLNDFLIQKPRPLPVIIAIDRSGSMGAEGKIDALNIALKDFINSIKDEDSNKAEIQVALLSFGGDNATYDIPLAPIHGVDVKTYNAEGSVGSPFSVRFKISNFC